MYDFEDEGPVEIFPVRLDKDVKNFDIDVRIELATDDPKDSSAPERADVSEPEPTEPPAPVDPALTLTEPKTVIDLTPSTPSPSTSSDGQSLPIEQEPTTDDLKEIEELLGKMTPTPPTPPSLPEPPAKPAPAEKASTKAQPTL